jgi:hypothetical protein
MVRLKKGTFKWQGCGRQTTTQLHCALWELYRLQSPREKLPNWTSCHLCTCPPGTAC